MPDEGRRPQRDGAARIRWAFPAAVAAAAAALALGAWLLRPAPGLGAGAAGGPAAAPAPAAAIPVPPLSHSASPATGRGIAGRVELAPALRSRPGPDHELVIAAYAVDGPRTPLAVQRHPVNALPLHFALDDSMAPNPAFRLSKAAQVLVSAHIGAPGSIQPASGDLQGFSEVVPAGSQGIAVRIDRVVP
jgi:cytochrome c-type biogenesis protein CcmH